MVGEGAGRASGLHLPESSHPGWALIEPRLGSC